MPKRKEYYLCEYCGKQFSTFDTCLEHECREHLHITVKEYYKWKELIKSAEDAGARVSYTKNPETDAQFDAIINELIEFEREHNLVGLD